MVFWMFGWCKAILFANILMMVLNIFPELAGFLRVYLTSTFNWLITVFQDIAFSMALFTGSSTILILSAVVGIVILFLILHIRKNKHEEKTESGRFYLQRLVKNGRGWRTIDEFEHPVEETYLEGHLTGTYRLMKMGENGRYGDKVWSTKWQGREPLKISLRELHEKAIQQGG